MSLKKWTTTATATTKKTNHEQEDSFLGDGGNSFYLELRDS